MKNVTARAKTPKVAPVISFHSFVVKLGAFFAPKEPGKGPHADVICQYFFGMKKLSALNHDKRQFSPYPLPTLSLHP